MTSLVSCFVESYVDLVLLWLLYRFMKPLKTLEDGTTEAEALLFAHDATSIENNLKATVKQENEKKKAKVL